MLNADEIEPWCDNIPADGDDELLALSGPVDGGQWPSDTDAKEDVDGVGASDVTDGGIGTVILNGGDLWGEGV